jgi:hypothetical protein
MGIGAVVEISSLGGPDGRESVPYLPWRSFLAHKSHLDGL